MAAFNIQIFENEAQNGPGMCRRWYQIHTLYSAKARAVSATSVIVGDDLDTMRSSIVEAGILGDYSVFSNRSRQSSAMVSSGNARGWNICDRTRWISVVYEWRSSAHKTLHGARGHIRVDNFCGLEIKQYDKAQPDNRENAVLYFWGCVTQRND